MNSLRHTVLLFSTFVAAAASSGCGSSSSGASTPSPVVGGGEAITGLKESTWTWVPIEGAFCRDGTGTGIGVNLSTKSDKVVIYLEGGGACFDPTSCTAMNPNHYDANTFKTTIGTEGSLGIFNRTDSTNPVADWSFVYFPYCTGDIHAGNNPKGNANNEIMGLGPQKFVGYANVSAALKRIVPTFPTTSQVLLTGISAGGFGAAANYVQVAKAFGSTPVFMLDDSGPAFENPYNATCLQQLVTNLWDLQQGSLGDCDGQCTNPASYQLDYIRHVATTYPKIPFGLVESTQDGIITRFFGYGTDNGNNDCHGNVITTPEDPTEFTQGLEDLRVKTKDLPNVGSFIIGAPSNMTQHTSLLTSLGETTPADGVQGGSAPQVKLTDWITQLLAGTVTTVGLPPESSLDGGIPPEGGTD